jgi:Protein of unknown function (DUF4238)
MRDVTSRARRAEQKPAVPPIARNHHYVPQCYLAGFTDTGTKLGRVWVFDFPLKRSYRQRPRNVAFEVDFNRLETVARPPDALERAFGQFETQVSSVIRQIAKNRTLPPDADLSYLVNFVTLLAVRHPAMRTSMESAQLGLYRVILDMLASDEQLFRSELKQAHQHGFVASGEFSFVRFRDFIRCGKYKITIPREDHIERELKVFSNLLHDVGNRHWSLITAADGAPDFITCDRPASLIHKQLLFPLNARCALLADREQPWRKHITVDSRGVAEVNNRLVDLACRQIYSRTEHVTLLDGDRPITVSLSMFGRNCGTVSKQNRRPPCEMKPGF